MIGIIGGTGLEKSEILKSPKKIKITTRFGDPSSSVITGEIGGKQVFIIKRHGEEHTITPSYVNYRANIQCLKDLGCKKILATTACGSLREEIKPGDFALVDQFIDFTKFRKNTFFESFEPGEMKHYPMAEPYSEEIRGKIILAAENVGIKLHTKATMITIEGPRFSTKAESKMFRMWGADLINMSTATETILANEAEIPYAAIAIATDYDCWKENEEYVSIDIVLQNFNKSIKNLINLLQKTITIL
ncbi:MAG: S-methyl-5'-thioadenosine phosphorylase [Bacteroidales bacterium]|jgi:5'-methylthioadenosine phosphorylase|nr:S-methyl-5'-thioadenosine phosphorylase [Bacteroidales bacterium]HOL98033.1 S-methyl-5'-thioadenosine phosphorylase [Bacteroidales bacterium]HOM36538.1 S-methyl-5'-thioadenosine phosphorylase [Bacteroidales bacterium]HPD23721.1 S-methyl-5'-thioadenosine phosphorylase [Bacteroidales bacterium]HRS99836.1 S-methyl-5'-thioadenosine phosphorylase [Bacteroidales bacterium]